MGLEPTLVCAISSPAGVGCGILATLKGAPCILVPLHVVGGPENAQRVRIAAEVGGKVTHLHLRPPPSEGWRLSSPEPPRGRAPDVNRMDYVIAPCELPATIDARTLTALDACHPPSVVPRGEEGTRGPVVEIVAAPASWLRARRPSSPSDQRTTNGRSGDGDEKSAPGDEPTGMDHPRTYLGRLTSHHASHRDGASSVAVRYDARTAAGASGAAVFETSVDGTYRRLVAMHRAGDPAAEVSAAAKHAEGLSIADIMRDVSEITAERAVRTGASAGDLRAAASELLLRPAAGVDGYESRGRRCRAAAAALRAAAEHPHRASRAACDLSGGGGDVDEGADALLRALEEWKELSATRSVRFADAAAHLAGSLARAELGEPLRYEIDELLLDVLLKHDKVEAIVSKTLWALRQRMKRRGGVNPALDQLIEQTTSRLRGARNDGEESSVHRELLLLDALMTSKRHTIA